MGNRRALIEGLHPDEEIDPEAAEEFIAGRKPRKAAKPAAPAAEGPATGTHPAARTRSSTRTTGTSAFTDYTCRAGIIPANRCRPRTGRRPRSHRACCNAQTRVA